MDDKSKKRKKDKQIKEKKEKRVEELLKEYNNDQERILKDLEKYEKFHSEGKLISASLKTKRKELMDLMKEKSNDPKWRNTYKLYKKHKKSNFSNIDEQRKEAEEMAAEKKRRRIEQEKNKPFLLLLSIPEEKHAKEEEEDEEIEEIPDPTYFIDEIPLPAFEDKEKEYVYTGKEELGFDPKGRLVFRVENRELMKQLLPKNPAAKPNQEENAKEEESAAQEGKEEQINENNEKKPFEDEADDEEFDPFADLEEEEEEEEEEEDDSFVPIFRPDLGN